MARKTNFAPTPISPRYNKPPSKKRTAAKAVGALAITGGGAYLGYRNKTNILRLATVARQGYNRNAAYVGVKTSIARRNVKTYYKATFRPGMRNAFAPGKTGYRIGRTMGNSKLKSSQLGAKNLYRHHKTKTPYYVNRAANAFHSYRRVRRDYKGRFSGWI